MDPYTFVKFAEIFGRITSTWPLHLETRNRPWLISNLTWKFGVFANVLCFALVFVKIRLIENDPIALSKSFSIIAIIGDSGLHLILVRIQWPRFQVLMQEVISYLKTAKPDETHVFRKYIKRYLSYNVVLYVSFFGAIGAFFFAPFILKKRFPIDAWYPFSTDPMFNRIVIYILQYVTILQTLALLSGDCMVLSLLIYASARLELLGLEFRKVDDAFGLRNCARKHQNIIRFVTETECAVRLLLIKNLFAVSISIICAGIQLSHLRSFTVLSQFSFILCIASVRLFGLTWAGDDLTEMSANLSWSIYQSPAVSKSFYLSKSLAIAIQRSQRRLNITMWGRSLGLSLEFFTNYALKVLSFFMTLRAVIDRYV